MKRKKVTDIDGECQEHGKFKLKGGVLNNLNGFTYNRVIYLLNVTLNCTQKKIIKKQIEFEESNKLSYPIYFTKKKKWAKYLS